MKIGMYRFIMPVICADLIFWIGGGRGHQLRLEVGGDHHQDRQNRDANT